MTTASHDVVLTGTDRESQTDEVRCRYVVPQSRVLNWWTDTSCEIVTLLNEYKKYSKLENAVVPSDSLEIPTCN
jgi:hypothetical protein